MELHFTQEEVYQMMNRFKSFYEGLNDITDYYLQKKLERLNNMTLEPVDGRVFNDYTMNPMDMDLELVEIDSKEFTELTTQIASFPIESQIGRKLTVGLKERSTNTWVGFVRISSPVSSIKPRNEYFGESLRLDKVNPHIYNGQTIVPVQPFGFNYLGGKLMSLVCISNEVREMFNKKYGTNILVFETTSLYGNTKTNSQYDGLEPYIKFKGLTESTNLLTPIDEIYFELRNKCREHYGNPNWNGMLVDPKPSSPKSRELNKVISILMNHIKVYDKTLHNELKVFLKTKCETKQQKRYYMSTFGFTNVKEHILTGEELIRPEPNKYDLENLINYWKRKSFNRWTKLTQEGRIQTELESYTSESITSGINFKMIR
jgi:hypothetical protein